MPYEEIELRPQETDDSESPEEPETITKMRVDVEGVKEAIETENWLELDVCLQGIIEDTAAFHPAANYREEFLAKLSGAENAINDLNIPEKILERRIKNNLAKAKRLLRNSGQ